MAEAEGFEPPAAFTATVFKTAPLNHSSTPPQGDNTLIIGSNACSVKLK